MLPTENEWNPLAKPSTLALTKRGLAPAESSTVALPTEEEVPTDEQTELNPREAPDDTEQEEDSYPPNDPQPLPELENNPFEPSQGGTRDESNHLDDSMNLSSGGGSPATSSPVDNNNNNNKDTINDHESATTITNEYENNNNNEDNDKYDNEDEDDPFYAELNQKESEEPPANFASTTEVDTALGGEESFFDKISGGQGEPEMEQAQPPPVILEEPSVEVGTKPKRGHNRVPSALVNSEEDDFFSSQLGVQSESIAEETNDPSSESVAPLPSEGKKTLSVPSSSHKRVPSVFTRQGNSEDDDFFSNLETSSTGLQEKNGPAEEQHPQSGGESEAFKFLADDDDELLEEDEEIKTAAPPSSKDMSSSLAFLEQDDDLLSEDDEVEENKPLAQINAQSQAPTDSYFAQKTTPNLSGTQGAFGSSSSAATPYTPYQPQQQQHHLQKHKSFVTETANNSFDLPTGMVSNKQSLRRVTSFQQPAAVPNNSYYSASYGVNSQTPSSAAGPPTATQPPKSSSQSKKPFFDELPIPPPKKPTPARRTSSNDGMPNMHLNYGPQQHGATTAAAPPPPQQVVPPKNPYAQPPPAPVQGGAATGSGYGHSPSSSADGGSVRSTSPFTNYHPQPEATNSQIPLAPPMEYVPPVNNPYAPNANKPQLRQSASTSYMPNSKTQTPPKSHVAPEANNNDTPSPPTNPYDPRNVQNKAPPPPPAGKQQPINTHRPPPPPQSHSQDVPPQPHHHQQQHPLPPPGKKPLSSAQSYGDLPMDIGSRPAISPRGSVADGMPNRSPPRPRRNQSPAEPPQHHGSNYPVHPQAKRNEATPPPPQQPQPQQSRVPAASTAVNQTIPATESPVDNEALARRQFPAFGWGVGKRSVAIIPPSIAFGSGMGTHTQIKLVDSHSVIDDTELLTKFPTPLMSVKGPIKSKKKELEKWCSDKINKLEATIESRQTYSARSEHKVMLWKLLRVFLKSDSTITKAIQDNLQEIREVLHPGARPLETGNGNSGLYNATDMYNRSLHNTPKSQHTNVNDAYVVSSFGSNELKDILEEIEVGNREGALSSAMEKHLWAHALIIAGSLGPDHWHRTVMEFVRGEVKAAHTPSANSLAFIYRVFSGAGGDSASELYPTQQAVDQASLEKTLDDWGNHLSLIISNPAPKNTEAILSLGKSLLRYGLVEASHICLLLSGMVTFFGNNDEEFPGVQLLGSDSVHGGAGLGRDTDSIMSSEIFEFIALSNPPQELGHSVTHFPHLLLYKIVHAELLADHGAFGDAHRMCENVTSFVKNAPKGTQFNKAFLERLDNVTARIGSIDEGAGSRGWFGGKLARPKLDKIWMQSFNKFVSGDDEDVASEASSTDKEGAIFKNLASTPSSIPRVESAAELSRQHYHPHTSGNEYGSEMYRTVSNPYAPPAPAAPSQQQPPTGPPTSSHQGRPGGANTLHRIQSYAGLPSAPMGNNNNNGYGGLGIKPTSSPIYAAPSAANNNRRAPEVNSVGPASRSSSIGAEDNNIPLPPARPNSAGMTGGYMPSNAINNYKPQKAPTRAYTPENPTDSNSPAQGSPASSSLASTSPQRRRQASPYNPYAPKPAAGATNSGNHTNPYAPAAPPVQEEEPPQPDYGMSMVDNPYGAIYGGEMPPAPEEEAIPYGQEPGMTTEQYNEGEEESIINDSYGYEPPPMYGYQAQDPEEEGGGDNFDPENSANGGGEFFVPIGGGGAPPIAPMPQQTPSSNYHYTPPTETIPEEEETEDLGISNSKSATEQAFEEAKRKQDEEDERKRQEQEAKKSGGGWFSWLRKNDDGQPKAIKAKLGEQSSFYYDENLKRWVNKKAPMEEQKSAAPPPPPKANRGPSSTASTPPVGNGFNNDSPPSGTGTPPPSQTGSGPPPPTSRPSTGPPKTGGGLDDLLSSTPPTGGGGKKGGRRSARNRYVDIMQK